MSTLFLCMYADGPLWDNLVRLPAYQSGMSYFRPFRYRDKWVEQRLLEEFGSADGRKALEDQEAVLAMRFLDPKFRNLLVPIRQATVRHIHNLPDVHSVYFTLGAMFDFRQASTLEEVASSLPDNEQDPFADVLVFWSELALPGASFVQPDAEEYAWVKYTALVAGSATLPVPADAKQSLFLRVLPPVRGDETIPPTLLHRSSQAGRLFGLAFDEGASYEVSYLHRLPYLIGRNTTGERFSMKYGLASTNLELNSKEEEITANYQPHYFELTARKPTGTWETLRIKPDRAVIKAQDGTPIQALDCTIPMKMKYSWKYRAKTSWIWGAVLVLAFIASSVFSYLYEATTDPEKAVSGGVLLVRTLGSGIVGFVIWALQQRVPRT
jgi:hypothetical protein